LIGLSRIDAEPYVGRGDTRPLALRQLELLLAGTIAGLNDTVLRPPSSEDHVCKAIPGLFEALNVRDGLLPLSPPMLPVQAGDDRLLVFGGHALCPHPDLRESRELVRVLWELTRAGHDVRIAVDPNRMLPVTRIPDIVLKDYWWGIKITRGSIDDLDAVGQTQHARRADLYDEWGAYPLLTTDFIWKREGYEKTLTIEETVPNEEPRPFAGPVRNRFLHSIRDTEQHSFRHLDGAIKAFDRDQYSIDRAHPSGPRDGFLHYRKLWRVEGPIDDRDWGRLVGYFFRGNELIIEYFGEILDERPGTLPTEG